MPHVPILTKDMIEPLSLPDGSRLDTREKADWHRMGGELGFFACQVPGLDDLRDELYRKTRQFFSLSPEEKMELAFNAIDQGPFGNVGYFSFGAETAVNGQAPDPKEFFHVGPSSRALQACPRQYPPTPYPRSMPEMAGLFEEAHDRLTDIAKNICHALCQLYDIDDRGLDDLLDGGNSILRLIRYPLAQAPESNILAFQHVGIQLLGLQISPDMGGLQYLLPDGSWVEPDFDTLSDCLIVNIGEMGSHLLGNAIDPSPHRVVMPRRVDKPERYSLVFFFHPDHRAPVTNLRTGEVRTKQSWGDWLNQRLGQLGLTDLAAQVTD